MVSKDYIRPFAKVQQKKIIIEQKMIESNKKTSENQTEDLV